MTRELNAKRLLSQGGKDTLTHMKLESLRVEPHQKQGPAVARGAKAYADARKANSWAQRLPRKQYKETLWAEAAVEVGWKPFPAVPNSGWSSAW